MLISFHSYMILENLLGDEACKTNVCGKGSCVPTSNSTFGFECQCQQGWKQSRPDDDQFFKFLPCVVPNCQFVFLLLFNLCFLQWFLHNLLNFLSNLTYGCVETISNQISTSFAVKRQILSKQTCLDYHYL